VVIVHQEHLPPWMKWQHRLFPDANLLLLKGRDAALVDSGFVATPTKQPNGSMRTPTTCGSW
jgi:hypothetical protein